MRNSKQQAQYLLAKLNRAIELSLEIPEDETWGQSLCNGNSYLHNIKSCLDRQPLQPQSPLDKLEKMYKYCLLEIRTLQPEGHYIPFIEFKKVIDKLPESLQPGIFETLSYEEIEKFGFSLWEAFDEYEIGFGLGDDGTDEMEQTIQLLGIIVTEYRQSSDPDKNAFNLIMKLLLHDKYSLPINGLMPSMYLSFVDSYNLLKYIEDNRVMYNDEVTLFFAHVQTEHLEPHQKDTTHTTILSLSNPELDLMIEAIQFYFDETCHDTTNELRAMKKSIEDKLQMELYARYQIKLY